MEIFHTTPPLISCCHINNSPAKSSFLTRTEKINRRYTDIYGLCKSLNNNIKLNQVVSFARQPDTLG